MLRDRRPGLPVWAHLAVFALSIVVPLWCLLGFGAWTTFRAERSDYEQQTLAVARNLALDLDRELAGFTAVLKVLATSPAIQDGDLARLHEQARQVVPEGGAIVLRDRTGQQLVNTLLPFGTPLPATTSQPVLDADACVFRTRQVCASNLYVGVTDRQHYVLLDAPVLRNGEVAYALNIAIRAQHLAALLLAHRTPTGWAVSILDRQDRIIARSAEHERFVGSLANEALRRQATATEGNVHTVNVAGIPVWGAYVRLPVWHWRIAIGVPEDILAAPFRQSMLYLGAGGLAAIGLSVAAALLYGRGLARSIRLLSRMAGQVGGAAPLPPVPTAIREVAQVGAALAATSAKLRASTAERDRAQAALRRLNEQLEARVEAEVAAREAAQLQAAQAQRLQALGQLAGGIAHDFNNVLQATAGCASAITRRATDAEAVRRFAKLILDAAKRGTSVTRRLLAFARQGDLRAEPIELPALFAGLQEILSHTLGAHIRVEVEVPAGLPPLFADRSQLETVLVNLATNARDAMAAGGTLGFTARAETIREQAAPPGQEKAPPPGLLPGDYLRIAVIDTGTGMDAATLARASEPFFSTKGRGAGNGLGLAMARGFAEQSGGALAIESQPGRGTTILLWFRASPEPAGATVPPGPAAPPEAAPDSAAARPRVLLVDDEEIVRQVVATQLEDEGYEVIAVADAAAALAMLETRGDIDALVTDLNMPGMNGVELIRAVRAQKLALPTILLTGNAEDGTPLAIEGAMTQNFSLLRKPVLGAELADRLAALTLAR